MPCSSDCLRDPKLPINKCWNYGRCRITAPEAVWSKREPRGYVGSISGNPLQDQALVLLVAPIPLQQGGTRGVLKHLPDALVGLGRALEVLVGTDLLADLLTLVV